MSRLPLFIETEEFRAVHAACIQSEIDDLRRHAILGMLSEGQLIRAVRKSDDLYKLAKAVAKVPEARLPYPHSFPDTGGKVRRDVRLKWWRDDEENWYQIAMSVSDIDNLPDEALPTDLLTSIYPRGDKPVFFGHYWLSGEPELQRANVLCFDYSAETDGPLVTYKYFSG